MNTSILICGADKGGRDEKALEIAKSASKREDVLFFDAGETRGIADIRKFISNLSKKPYSNQYSSRASFRISPLNVIFATGVYATNDYGHPLIGRSSLVMNLPAAPGREICSTCFYESRY